MKKKNTKKKYSKKKGGENTTIGCPNCPANNPSMSELAWNNRYSYGKGCASGWGLYNCPSCNLKGGNKTIRRRRLII